MIYVVIHNTIVQIEEPKITSAGYLIYPLEDVTALIHYSFQHKSEADAQKEIEDRRQRLAHAISESDTVLAYAIEREHHHKLTGKSRSDMHETLEHEQIAYEHWLDHSKEEWFKRTHKVPTDKELSTSLTAFEAIKAAHTHPLSWIYQSKLRHDIIEEDIKRIGD